MLSWLGPFECLFQTGGVSTPGTNIDMGFVEAKPVPRTTLNGLAVSRDESLPPAAG